MRTRGFDHHSRHPARRARCRKGALALDPRGTMYDKTNIGQILDMRNFMDTLRGSGVETGGPDSFGQRERMKFANELDRFIARR